MTMDEFMEKLFWTKREWKLMQYSEYHPTQLIRCECGCPIVVVANGWNVQDYKTCAKVLELSEVDTRMIVSAADGQGYPDIRKRLLEACGLMEDKAGN